MFRSLLRKAGFALISYGTLFTPLIASAEDGDVTIAAVAGFPIGAIITGCILVSLSHAKEKATKADDYVHGKLKINEQSDVYLRTTTDKEEIGD
jgi:hypothetical protein